VPTEEKEEEEEEEGEKEEKEEKRLLDAVSVQQPQRPTTFHVYKTRGC
jgi:hypothetical protein